MSDLDPVKVKQNLTVILTLKYASGNHKTASRRAIDELNLKSVKYDMQKGNENA